MSDNRRLSRKQARSDEDLAEGIGRLVRALGRRCAAGEPDGAALLAVIREDLDEAYAASVAGWRAAGYSDADIGRELAVSKQAVQKRWPR